jgi:hypothetical protein
MTVIKKDSKTLGFDLDPTITGHPPNVESNTTVFVARKKPVDYSKDGIYFNRIKG